MIIEKIKSILLSDTENPSTQSEELNIKAEPLFYARELHEEVSDYKEENDSENFD